MFDALSTKAKLEQPLLDEEAAAPSSASRRLTSAQRMQRYLEASALSADSVNPSMGKYLRLASPLLTGIVSVLVYVAPFYMLLYKKVRCLFTRHVTR